MNTGPIAERVLGQYPLSIATSLAIEGSLGIHPDRPSPEKPLLDYEVIWVNLKTVYRNLYNAIDRSDVLTVHPMDMYHALVEELERLHEVIREATGGKMSMVLYVSDYAGLDREFPKAFLRKDTTPLQQTYTSAMVATLTPYLREYKGQYMLYRLRLTDTEQRKALMLTHYAFDLCSKSFRNVALLESHTGTVKQKHQWYTKYHNGKELSQIPFREDFLQIFGDSEHFRPQSLGMRKALIELANQYNWSQITTRDKINYSLGQMKDRFLAETIRSMMR